jgi:RNase P/RNase MRP subunit p29
MYECRRGIMKKLIGIVVAVVMMIGLSACSKNNNGTTGPVVESTKTVIVIVSNGMADIHIYINNNNFNNEDGTPVDLSSTACADPTGNSLRAYSVSYTKNIVISGWATNSSDYIWVDTGGAIGNDDYNPYSTLFLMIHN